MAKGNGNGTATTPMTLAAVDAQLAVLDEAIRAQDGVIAEAEAAVREKRRAREEAEIREVLGQAKAAEVAELRTVERQARAAADVEVDKKPGLTAAYERLVAQRPAAEAVALQERLMALRREYSTALGTLAEALAAVEVANRAVLKVEQAAVGLCPHHSPLRRLARLSAGASNLGFQHLAWPEFISDGTLSRYQSWKREAKAALHMPADLHKLLEPAAAEIVKPTPAEEYWRVRDLLVGGPQPKAPRQDQPAARRFR
jgi:hypothetical protein